ncbi:hypothetical protein GQX73_g10475 [Xylaria multiplex]|uniref:Uncharacterized protein n=1 Tax=Xylaria multiplex TaxID=323545 RepID=A0A7C8IGJ0_9PEZI|nr:hypothetical protein GQX73_g10475 [Xylaria multiplex]
MRFTTAFVASVGLAAVHAVPLALPDATGCRVDLAPTLAQPQNAASNIVFSTLSKWVNSTQSLYFSTSYLDTRNTTKAPFSVVFKDNMIPDFQTTDSIAAVLNTWVGTYLAGGATPKSDDFAITGVNCS